MADDEPDILSVMAKKVAQEGYEVVTAPDGQQAWDKIHTESPDVIILDLNMPHKDGFEILKGLREQKPLPAKWQPVIIVSARRELDDVQKGFSLEADHYLTKPCQVADILKAIKLVLRLAPNRTAQSNETGTK